MDLPVLIPRVKKRPSPRDPRGVVRETTPSHANKRRCTPGSPPCGRPLRGRGIRAGRVSLCPLPTFSGRVRFRGVSRGRSRRRRARHFFGQSRLPEKLPRSSCPRNPLSVGLTLALSCGRGLTRTYRGSLRGGLRPLRGVAARALDLRSARLPSDFAALRLIYGASCGARRGYRPALMVARCAAMPRRCPRL